MTIFTGGNDAAFTPVIRMCFLYGEDCKDGQLPEEVAKIVLVGYLKLVEPSRTLRS